MTVSSTEAAAIVEEAEHEAWNEGNLDAIDEHYAADYVMHDPMGERDRAALKEMTESILAGTSDFELRFDELWAEGDRVVARYTLGGVNTGPSFLTEEPTGNEWASSGIAIYRIDDGQIAEQWNCFDYLGTMQQLGLLPAAPEG